jgi:Na+-translocating ferredoxin:NAD+ oxidoreductase subunit D
LEIKDNIFEVSSAPHIHNNDSIKKIMLSVILALLPAVAVAVFYFRYDALRVIVLSIAFCVLSEYISAKFLNQKNSLGDLSACVTGLLLALNFPATAPYWLIFIGSFVAIFVGKQIFGGIGCNIFNPALVGRVFLLIAYPVEMTTWVKPLPLLKIKEFFNVSSITSATPLGILKENGISEITTDIYYDAFFGNIGGSIGEISVLAILIGALFLVYKGHIYLKVPLSFIGTVFFITLLFWVKDPTKYAEPFFHIFTGGLMLGAFFMATDMTTSPITATGMIIFGVGCGLITAVIRLFGVYPEGVSFAILFMNALVPLIDKYIKPKRYGVENL